MSKAAMARRRARRGYKSPFEENISNVSKENRHKEKNNLIANNILLEQNGMRRIPILSVQEYETSSRTDYMPKQEEIPQEFWIGSNIYRNFISIWFFKGLNEKVLRNLIPKPFVDKKSALQAIYVLIQYNLNVAKIEHNYKMAACSFLLSEWFIIE